MIERLRDLFRRKPKGYRFPNGIPRVEAGLPGATFRLWDKDFNLLATWQGGAPLLVSVDREGFKRETGVLDDLRVSGYWIVHTAPADPDDLL